MAAPNFPDTPANNDIYIYNNVEYTYDAPKGSWRSSRLRVSSDILSVNGSANSIFTAGVNPIDHLLSLPEFENYQKIN